MEIKGILFDINGTLIDIRTDEGGDDLYRTMSNILSYQGITPGRRRLKELYYEIMHEQREKSGERHPEFDAVGIFREIIARLATDRTRSLPAAKMKQLPLFMAEAYRAASRHQLRLYHGVRETLDQVREKYRLGIVSDGQTAYAVPELSIVGLAEYFNPIIVSGDFGYRKPDSRLFETALKKMKLKASEALFVGNDIYHDVHGAQKVGMKAVQYKSNQGRFEKEGISADYIIYNFPELLNAIEFFKNDQ